MFAFFWALGSSLSQRSADKFEAEISKHFPPNDLPRGSIYDYFLEFTKPEGDFKNWN